MPSRKPCQAHATSRRAPPVGGITLSGGRSPYLRPRQDRGRPCGKDPSATHTLASVEPASIPSVRGSQLGCGLSLSPRFLPCPNHRNRWVVNPPGGTECLARVPRIQVCRPPSPQVLWRGGGTRPRLIRPGLGL
jgi:hypothetical protein